MVIISVFYCILYKIHLFQKPKSTTAAEAVLQINAGMFNPDERGVTTGEVIQVSEV